MARDATLAGRGDLTPLEIWASPEPTVARIDAATVRDQLAETGHGARARDLDLLASLGIHASRTPVLWEHEAHLAHYAARAERLHDLGVEPIVTLLHHGSGPAHTSLVDSSFPLLLADYAERVARALPWVRRWTPVNEPLTTARFSALYGVWYPNAHDDRAFGRAIVNETLGTQLAMERIRAIVPGAELVLTEDLQRFTAADDAVAPYAEFLRDRVFLSAELLAGRVVEGHPLYDFLIERCGIAPGELREVALHAMPPDLVAFNHYPHSERYLFTAHDGSIGDVPAVYIDGEPPLRAGPLLRAAAQRLQMPLALGEVHVHASAPERVRWLAQHAADVYEARDAGIDIRAIGAWAAFGMVDWHSLLRRRDGVSEDGVFTFAGRDGVPERTAVADAVATLARGEHLCANGTPGWWEQPERIRSTRELLAMRAAGLAEGAHIVGVKAGS